MDVLQAHLLLNYYPAIGMVAGALMIMAGYVFKSEGIKRASLKLFIAIALLTFPAYVTGEIGGSRNKESYTGPYAESLQRHKDAARPTFLLAELVGITALTGYFLLRRGSAKAGWALHATLVLSIAASGALIWTVLAGRHVKWSGTSKTAVSSQMKDR